MKHLHIDAHDPMEEIARSRDVSAFRVGQQVLWRTWVGTQPGVVDAVQPKGAYQLRIRLKNGSVVHAVPSEVTIIPALETLEQVESYLAG